jgi:protein-S-isoprenylcysteine O-methyltransferase Ste14
MQSTPALPPAAGHTNVTTGIVARAAQIAAGFVVVAAALFLGAGRLDWPWAWLYLGVSLIIVLVNGALLLRRSPTTIAERGRPGEMQGWDKLISGLWAAALYLALPLVAGLDLRFGWTPALSAGWHWAGLLLYIAGMALTSWAMVVNAFFSTAVRIQRERGQTVCHSGPYRIVRHPGYAGFILVALGLPVLLGSAWAALPSVASVALMVARTVLEDRLLRAELPGYEEYARAVRFRLVPGLW